MAGAEIMVPAGLGERWRADIPSRKTAFRGILLVRSQWSPKLCGRTHVRDMSPPPSQPIIPMPRITGRRALPRVRLYIPAKALLLHGQENCLLDDLSQAGARVTIAARLPSVGAGVVLKANGLDVFGNVVWAQGARFGIVFEEPLPLHEVVNVRHFADAHADHERALLRRTARNFVQGRPPLKSFS